MSGHDLSIVVPCVDEHDLLEGFLASVAERLPACEVVVVNMGGWRPPDDLGLALRLVPSPLRSIAGAKNTGLAHAGRTYVALMDSDNVLLGPPEDWRRLDEAMAGGPSLVTLGRHEAGRRLGEGVTPNRWNFSRHTIGWSVVWRREHLLALGGFDERFGTGTLAGCGEDFPPLYRHFAEPGATTRALPELAVGHPSLQKAVSARRLYRYTYGSAISTLLFIRSDRSPMACYWAAKTVLGFGADLFRGLRRGDLAWTATVLRARARACADALLLGRPRKIAGDGP